MKKTYEYGSHKKQMVLDCQAEWETLCYPEVRICEIIQEEIDEQGITGCGEIQDIDFDDENNIVEIWYDNEKIFLEYTEDNSGKWNHYFCNNSVISESLAGLSERLEVSDIIPDFSGNADDDTIEKLVEWINEKE